jgi:hypothetical protein
MLPTVSKDLTTMRAIHFWIVLTALLAGATALAQPVAISGSAVVAEVTGNVRLWTGNEAPRLATKERTLAPGTLITTAEGASAVLAFTDGQLVVLGEGTRLRIVDYRYDSSELSKSGAFLNLIEGSARLVMGAIGQFDPRLVRIQVGTNTVGGLTDPAGARGDAGVVVQGMATLLEVASGRVSLTLPSGQSIQVAAGQGALVRIDGTVAQGSTAQINALASQTSDGKLMVGHLAQMQNFPMPAASAVTEILLAASVGEFLEQLPSPAAIPATASPTTAGTGGGGGGGLPCTASCN